MKYFRTVTISRMGTCIRAKRRDWAWTMTGSWMEPSLIGEVRLVGYQRLELDGKVAVVIGGSSGIGRTLARGLAEAGADVVPSARRMELVNVVADEIESVGRRSLRVSSDVGDRGSLEKLLQASVQAFGKV